MATMSQKINWSWQSVLEQVANQSTIGDQIDELAERSFYECFGMGSRDRLAIILSWLARNPGRIHSLLHAADQSDVAKRLKDVL